MSRRRARAIIRRERLRSNRLTVEMPIVPEPSTVFLEFLEWIKAQLLAAHYDPRLAPWQDEAMKNLMNPKVKKIQIKR